ncbi:MAG: hypothetical protein WD895_09850 [Acidimicrobiia bacterium]
MSSSRASRWLGSAFVVIWVAACGSPGAGASDTTTSSPDANAPSEYVERLVECLRRGGGDVDWINPVTFSARPGHGMSDEAMRSLMSECKVQLGPAPERRTDPETARRVYSEYTKIYACLVNLGYTPSAPPSMDAFVEGFESGELGWHPYNGLESQFESFAEQLRVEDECPPWVE